MAALALALAAMGQGDAQDAPPRFTVEEWRKLSERQRSISIIGGIEGLMLAASGPRGDETHIDQACLSGATIPGIAAKLSDEETPSGTPFTLALLEAAGCIR